MPQVLRPASDPSQPSGMEPSYELVVSEDAVRHIVKLVLLTSTRLAISCQATDTPLRARITRLKGLGREVWQDVDVMSYLSALRDAWERR